jgi:hypothetical protein
VQTPPVAEVTRVQTALRIRATECDASLCLANPTLELRAGERWLSFDAALGPASQQHSLRVELIPIEVDRLASFLHAAGDETEWSTAPDDFSLTLTPEAPGFVRLRARSWDATNERSATCDFILSDSELASLIHTLQAFLLAAPDAETRTGLESADGRQGFRFGRLRRTSERTSPVTIACDVGDLAADTATIDALARLQLTAKRVGLELHLRRASRELQNQLTFFGLTEALPLEQSETR